MIQERKKNNLQNIVNHDCISDVCWYQNKHQIIFLSKRGRNFNTTMSEK